MNEKPLNRTAAIHNLGCKVNVYESEAMGRLFGEAGFSLVPFEEKADVYLINTCCVTATAEKKSRQMIHRARKANPEAVVIAAGCYSEIAANALLSDGAADIIIGSKGKKDIIGILESGRRGIIRDDDPLNRYEELNAGAVRTHTRGFIKIEDGCDNFCSYCIIPYARGRVRSRARSDILDEIRGLAGEGCQEIVISGINLSAYGKDLDDPDALSGILKEAAKIDGIKRIRLGSVEPRIITEQFLETLGETGKICPHFHLSLQSGCAKTLRAMNRKYTPEEYFEKCSMIRRYFKEPSLTTDLIAGFPGETEEDFAESFGFVRSVGFFETHVFPYSRREGTKAAEMDGQIENSVKKERVARYLELNRTVHEAYLKKRIGTQVHVLFEETEEVNGLLMHAGHTERYEKVLTDAASARSGGICPVTIKRTGTDAAGGSCLVACE